LPAEAQITPRASASAAGVHHLVVGAAQLEAEHRLLVFALEQHVVAEAARQAARRLQRGFTRHVVDAGGEDALEVIGRDALRLRERWRGARRALGQDVCCLRAWSWEGLIRGGGSYGRARAHIKKPGTLGAPGRIHR
jgi:hypothetical protein